MIKWLSRILFPNKETEELRPVPVLENSESKDKMAGYLLPWTLEGRLHFLSLLRTCLMEYRVFIKEEDPRYLKITYWLELISIVEESMEHCGLRSRILDSLRLKDIGGQYENINQQS